MQSSTVVEDRQASTFNQYGLLYGEEVEDDSRSSSSTLRFEALNFTQNDVYDGLSTRAPTDIITNRYSGLYSLNSSHSWGDEMGDYDREASRIVKELFSGIESILFENVQSPINDNGKYSAQLKLECSDWCTRFPHLRVLGSQVGALEPDVSEALSDQFFSDYELTTLVDQTTGETSRTVVSLYSLLGDSDGNNVPPGHTEVDAKQATRTAETAPAPAPVETFVVRGTGMTIRAANKREVEQYALFVQGDVTANEENSFTHVEELIAAEGQYEEVIAVDSHLWLNGKPKHAAAFCRYEDRAEQLAKLTADPQTPVPLLRDNVLLRLFDLDWGAFVGWLRPLAAELISRSSGVDGTQDAHVVDTRRDDVRPNLDGKQAVATDRTPYRTANRGAGDLALIGSQMLAPVAAYSGVTQRDASEGVSSIGLRAPLPAVPENKALLNSVLHISTKPVQLREKSNLSSSQFSDGQLLGTEASASSTARPDSSLPSITAHRFRSSSRLGSAQYAQYLPKHNGRLAPLQLPSQIERRSNLALNMVGHNEPKRVRDSVRSGSANVPSSSTKERALTGVLTVSSQTQPLAARERSVSLAPASSHERTGTSQANLEFSMYQSPQHSFVSVGSVAQAQVQAQTQSGASAKEKPVSSALRHTRVPRQTGTLQSPNQNQNRQPEPNRSESPVFAPSYRPFTQTSSELSVSMSNMPPNAGLSTLPPAANRSAFTSQPVRNATHLHHSTFTHNLQQPSTTQGASRNPGHFGITGNSIPLNNRLLYSGSMNTLAALEQSTMSAAENPGGASVPLIRRSKATVSTLR